MSSDSMNLSSNEARTETETFPAKSKGTNDLGTGAKITRGRRKGEDSSRIWRIEVWLTDNRANHNENRFVVQTPSRTPARDSCTMTRY